MSNSWTLQQPAVASPSGSRALRTTAIVLTIAAAALGLALYLATGQLSATILVTPLLGLAVVSLYLHVRVAMAPQHTRQPAPGLER